MAVALVDVGLVWLFYHKSNDSSIIVLYHLDLTAGGGGSCCCCCCCCCCIILMPHHPSSASALVETKHAHAYICLHVSIDWFWLVFIIAIVLLLHLLLLQFSYNSTQCFIYNSSLIPIPYEGRMNWFESESERERDRLYSICHTRFGFTLNSPPTNKHTHTHDSYPHIFPYDEEHCKYINNNIATSIAIKKTLISPSPIHTHTHTHTHHQL